jgi:hypothetical protein
MEFTEANDTDRVATERSQDTESTYMLSTNKTLYLRLQLMKWRYYNFALTLTFLLLIINISLCTSTDYALAPLFVYDIWHSRVLQCTLMTEDS